MTRLGQIGVGVQPYGTFDPKEAAPDTGPHEPGIITRLGQFGVGFAKYGVFLAKSEAIPEPEPEEVIQTVSGGGIAVYPRKKRKSLNELVRDWVDVTLQEMYEATREVAKEEAVAIVKPFVAKRSSVNWKAFERDVKRVDALIALYEKRVIQEQELEDEDEMLLMMH